MRDVAKNPAGCADRPPELEEAQHKSHTMSTLTGDDARESGLNGIQTFVKAMAGLIR
jgi:hypothetical protein